jgi:hypothetical protein
VTEKFIPVPRGGAMRRLREIVIEGFEYLVEVLAWLPGLMELSVGLDEKETFQDTSNAVLVG